MIITLLIILLILLSHLLPRKLRKKVIGNIARAVNSVRRKIRRA
jgi:hypothetical protein